MGSMTMKASAIAADVAKKCDALVVRTFPPREPGNPAAGNIKGTALAKRKYFWLTWEA